MKAYLYNLRCELKRAIAESVTPDILEYFNGMAPEPINELVILAQRYGVETAAVELESLVAHSRATKSLAKHMEYKSRLKAKRDRDDIRAAANRATAADIILRQHATISRAIELMTAELAEMTDGTDPDGVTWRDIEPHASTADLAELICEQHARRKP